MKMHQLIANEGEVAKGYEKIKSETFKVFKEAGLFEGFSREYAALDADDPDKVPREGKEVVTTVPRRLDWTREQAVKLIDHELARDETNMTARSSLVIDGVIIGTNVPATFLLVLEKRVKELRAVYDAIPTLDMAHNWAPTEAGSDIVKYGPTLAQRNKNKLVPVVLYPATEKHPAQVKESQESIPVGMFSRVDFSGKVTPNTKARLLGRIDTLIQAIRDARTQANNADVVRMDGFGVALFNFIHAE